MEWDAGRWERICEICQTEGCWNCEGHGWIPETVSPKELVGLEGQDLFQAYRWLKNYSSFPEPGTWRRQSVRFITCVELCDTVNALYAQREKKRKAESERMAKIMQEMVDRGRRSR